VDEKVQSTFIAIVTAAPELQTYTVGKLYLALLQDLKQVCCLLQTYNIAHANPIL
jgi:hypothetical protein